MASLCQMLSGRSEPKVLAGRDDQPGPAGQPEVHMVRSLVPVSVRAPGEENIYENRVSAVLADLPVHIADPVWGA